MDTLAFDCICKQPLLYLISHQGNFSELERFLNRHAQYFISSSIKTFLLLSGCNAQNGGHNVEPVI